MNSDNPYAPPSADLMVPASSQAIPAKPRSVWVMQIVGGLTAALCTLGVIRVGYQALLGQATGVFGVPIWLHFLMQSLVAVLLFQMLWQLPKRSRTGRNLGLGLIALFVIPLALRLLGTPVKNSAEAFGALTAAAIVIGPFVYWAFAFAFSAKAQRYFSAATAND